MDRQPLLGRAQEHAVELGPNALERGGRRAARRLEEAASTRAFTIHRLLEWIPGEGPARSADHPIECDLLVVDESSMLSLAVARTLLDAVGEETHVVLPLITWRVPRALK